MTKPAPRASRGQRRADAFSVDVCLPCFLYFGQGRPPPARHAATAAQLDNRFPNHAIRVTDRDPELFSTLPCSACFSGTPGQRHAVHVRRRLACAGEAPVRPAA